MALRAALCPVVRFQDYVGFRSLTTSFALPEHADRHSPEYPVVPRIGFRVPEVAYGAHRGRSRARCFAMDTTVPPSSSHRQTLHGRSSPTASSVSSARCASSGLHAPHLATAACNWRVVGFLDRRAGSPAPLTCVGRAPRFPGWVARRPRSCVTTFASPSSRSTHPTAQTTWRASLTT